MDLIGHMTMIEGAKRLSFWFDTLQTWGKVQFWDVFVQEMKMRRSTLGSSVWGNPRVFEAIDQIAGKPHKYQN